MNVGRIFVVVSKEWREVVRDPITVGVSVLLPLVMLFLFGYAITLDVDEVAFGVLDQDKRPASRALVDQFVQSGYFSLREDYRSVAQVEDSLQRGRVKLALVIPPGFQTSLERQAAPAVQILVDGTYSVTALIAANYATTIVEDFGSATERPQAVRLETRVWYNPSLRSVNYVVPGLYAVILMAFPPLLTALALVREKESGTVLQIYASPLTPGEFVIGKLIPYGLIAFGQMIMVISVGFLWFGVPFHGNLGFLLATAFVFVFCTVGIGLLVSTVTRKQLTAMLLALIITLMPSFLFSGFLFPIFTMPYVLQLYTRIFPARYFVELSRGIVLKGETLDALWLNLLLLLAYTLIVFWLAAWRFRKKVA